MPYPQSPSVGEPVPMAAGRCQGGVESRATLFTFLSLCSPPAAPHLCRLSQGLHEVKRTDGAPPPSRRPPPSLGRPGPTRGSLGGWDWLPGTAKSWCRKGRFSADHTVPVTCALVLCQTFASQAPADTFVAKAQRAGWFQALAVCWTSG